MDEKGVLLKGSSHREEIANLYNFQKKKNKEDNKNKKETYNSHSAKLPIKRKEVKIRRKTKFLEVNEIE